MHQYDDDAVCENCGFDGAEFAALRSAYPPGEALKNCARPHLARRRGNLSAITGATEPMLAKASVNQWRQSRRHRLTLNGETMKYPVSVLSCVKPGKILHLLDLLHSESVYDAHERTQRRLELHRAKDKAEDGKVAVVWSGRDCDGVRYSGDVCLVDADWRSLEQHIEKTYAWADGPAGISSCRPAKPRRWKARAAT